MNALKTKGIVLARVDYGEADRIITVLTEDYGKLSLMAKGARRLKSKLAGGVELFSVNEISFINGRGEVGTLISARMAKNYPDVLKDIDRVQSGYEMLKKINKNTEQDVGGEYFGMLNKGLEALNDNKINFQLLMLWFEAQLLNLAGHRPNLTHDQTGSKLSQDQKYIFDFDNMALSPNENGKYSASEIKILRLFFATDSPLILQKVKDIESYMEPASQVIKYTSNSYLA